MWLVCWYLGVDVVGLVCLFDVDNVCELCVVLVWLVDVWSIWWDVVFVLNDVCGLVVCVFDVDLIGC